MWSPNEDFVESVPGITHRGSALVKKKIDDILTKICDVNVNAARNVAENEGPQGGAHSDGKKQSSATVTGNVGDFSTIVRK